MNSIKNIKEIKKIVVIGPECTGKSDLSEYLARHYQTAWVKEYARAYLENLNRDYEESDLVKIAHGQIRMEDEWLYEANKVLICDTNLLVIKIWSEYKYGHCHEEILQLLHSKTYDLFLLTYIDIPWEADAQREHPEDREKLWNIYKKTLEKQKVPCVEIRGDRKQRRAIAVREIDRLIDLKK